MRRKMIAEAFGTFVLLFAGTGAIVVNDLHGSVTHPGIAATFGLVVLALIYTFGDVSGTHINPVVTIAFAVARRFPLREVLPYLFSQALGAIVASLVLLLLFPTHQTLGATRPAGSPWQSFVMELLLTLILMVVVFRVSTGAKEKGITAGIAIGSVIGLEALFAGPVCGASMNPVRSLAPALVSGHLESLWIYLTAPVLGALLAVGIDWTIQEPKTDTTFTGDTEMSNITKKRILFVCVENSNRSQMAEAFARMHGSNHIEAHSSGSRPSGRVNPKAIEAMRELGYDLTTHTSKGLDEFNGTKVDVAITMGCGDECPLVRADERIDWQIPDPRDMTPEQFREVRDLIQRKVKELIARL